MEPLHNEREPCWLLTPGINITQPHSSALWTHGPYWLPFESQWPSWNLSQVLHINSSNDVDAETPVDESTQTEPAEENFYVIDVSRYSTPRKLLAVTAYVLRFVRNVQSRETRATGPLSAKEQHVAHHKWTKDCQRVTYAAETINLLSHYSSTRLPLVRQLRLLLDCDGLIRSN